jgi:hypothetical protein
MPKRERPLTRVLATHTRSAPFASALMGPTREHVFEWVQHKMPRVMPEARSSEVKTMAKQILGRSRGLIVSSTMALSTAIVAMRGHGDYASNSMELGLLQAVLRYSEHHQVPPKIVMQLIADEEKPDEPLLEERESGFLPDRRS